jgi:hypothetical protein
MSRAVGRRRAGSFSVILGVFANLDFGTTVTLAQVFRPRAAARPGQPDRFYAVADQMLSIGSHSDTLPEYGREFRRRLERAGAGTRAGTGVPVAGVAAAAPTPRSITAPVLAGPA